MAMKDKTGKMSASFDSVELTEAIVLTRTRAPDLESVKKLNCWASNIGDVRVVRRMPALEVCSLSINKITSLRDFAHCHHLKELYVRTNKIERLGDIHYLKHLRKLRSLWLSENPCAGEPNYRMTVLRTLPNLRKLDNIAVTEDEVQKAETEGDQIPIPEDFSSSSIFSIEALSTGDTKSSVSPPNSARSLDSERGGGSVCESVGGASAENGGVEVSVTSSDGRWALPRRKRQQRKREEMLRSSGEDSSGGGGGAVPNREQGKEGGVENGTSPVGDSSDSHTEEESDRCGDKNVKMDEEKQDVVCDGDEEKSLLENSGRKSNDGSSDFLIKKPDVEESSRTVEEAESGDKPYVRCSETDGHSKTIFSDESKDSSAISQSVTDSLHANPEGPSVPDRVGSINVLRISDLEQTGDSQAIPSSNSTLVPAGEVPAVDDADSSNNSNNNNSTTDKSSPTTRSSCPSENKSPVVEQPCSESEPKGLAAQPTQADTDKQNKCSLLDQIRLNDSLDVMDSAADECCPPRPETAAVINHEHLEIAVDESPTSDTSKQTQPQVSSLDADIKTTDTDDAASKAWRPKPPVPAKTKAMSINWEEHNRLRAELGVKPMDSTKTAPVPPNMEITRARNSNILQAVLSLLKELDKDSLDIVGAAVKARLDAME